MGSSGAAVESNGLVAMLPAFTGAVRVPGGAAVEARDRLGVSDLRMPEPAAAFAGAAAPRNTQRHGRFLYPGRLGGTEHSMAPAKKATPTLQLRRTRPGAVAALQLQRSAQERPARNLSQNGLSQNGYGSKWSSFRVCLRAP